MFYIIYQITNKVNGKIYIGKHQTKDLNDGYMGSGKHLKRAINKYGIENFSKEILFQFDNEDEMNAKEAELVTEEFCLKEDNYNLCPGGKGGFGYLNNQYWTYDKRLEHVIKISGFKKENGFDRSEYVNAYKENGKRLHNDMLRKFPKSGFYGKQRTDEWKEAHSKIMKEKQSGHKNSQFGKFWITNGIESKKVSSEDSIPEGWYRGRKMK
jgi:hypothetical protein